MKVSEKHIHVRYIYRFQPIQTELELNNLNIVIELTTSL